METADHCLQALAGAPRLKDEKETDSAIYTCTWTHRYVSIQYSIRDQGSGWCYATITKSRYRAASSSTCITPEPISLHCIHAASQLFNLQDTILRRLTQDSNLRHIILPINQELFKLLRLASTEINQLARISCKVKQLPSIWPCRS